METHHQVKLCSDDSSFAWGCVLDPDTFSATMRDYWPVDQRHLHINVKKAWALANALDAFSGSLRDSWVDVYTDSQVLISSWRRQGPKPQDPVVALKRVFGIISSCNIHPISFTFPPLLIPRTLLPLFCRCRILSFPLLSGVKFKPDLVANLVTPQI